MSDTKPTAYELYEFGRWLRDHQEPREGTRRVVERFRYPAGFWGSRCGRVVYHLTDAELPRYLAGTSYSSNQWGTRTVVMADGSHVATLGPVAATSRRARRTNGRRSRASRTR
jgi:hypothetical protein